MLLQKKNIKRDTPTRENHCGHKSVGVLLGRCHLRHSYDIFPATLLHAGALSGVACRSVALHAFLFQQHSYTLVPTVVSRVGISQMTFSSNTPTRWCTQWCCVGVSCLTFFFLQHFYTPVPTVVSRAGMSQMTFSQHTPTRWCPQWCRV